MSLPTRILSLSDSQLEAVMAAAHPLDSSQRPLFLEALADLFGDSRDVGDGALFRALRELQREYRGSLGRKHGAHHTGCYRSRHAG